MPKGDNKVTINFTTEMKQFGDSKKGDLYLSFFTALAFLQYYKDEFIAKYGQECYDGHIKRYSIPAVEVRNNSAQRKKENLAVKRRELELREKELEVKANFLQAETERMRDKHEDKGKQKDNSATVKLKEEIALCELRLKNKQGSPQYWEGRLKQAKERLEIHQSIV